MNTYGQAPNFLHFLLIVLFVFLIFLSSFLWFNSADIFYLNHISSKAIIYLYFLKGHHLFSWGLYIFCFTQSTLNLYTIVFIQEPTIIDIFFFSFFGHHTSFYNRKWSFGASFHYINSHCVSRPPVDLLGEPGWFPAGSPPSIVYGS